MKVRVCPKCGKQNPEDTFNCVDCGTTLSIKTIMDSESNQFINVIPIAGHTQLANISQYFEPEITQILKTTNDKSETIVWGCNITYLTPEAPFLFGFVIVTSLRLIRVYFESQLDALGAPIRSHLEFLPEFIGKLDPRRRDEEFQTRSSALDRPQFPLTDSEKTSQWISIYNLENFVSTHLAHEWFGDSLLVSMAAKFIQIDDTTPTSLIPDNADQAYEEMTATFILPDDAERLSELLKARKQNLPGRYVD